MKRFFSIALALIVASSNVFAQAADPVTAYNDAVRAISQEKWDEGLTAVNGIIKAYEKDGKTEFGPVFGHFFYLRGLLLLGKKNFGGAIGSFKTCYEDYPNDTLKSDPGSNKNKMPNKFRMAALVQWANVLMHQTSYSEAAELYEKALAEGKNDSQINRIYVAVNLGRCRIKSGDPEGGFQLISPALQNERASEGLKQVIFMILAEDWSPQVELPPMRDFLNDFRLIVSQDSVEDRFSRNSRFQRLAQGAIADEDPIRALAWYGLMVNPRELDPVVDQQIEAMESREVPKEFESRKQEAIVSLQEEKASLASGSWALINGVGSAHFQMRNFSASYVAFRKLCEEVPDDHSERPVYLHNVVASAAQTGKWQEAYHYGKIFLAAYPEHELMPGVARVLVEVIYLRGEYQEAYDIATDVREKMTPGEAIRDIPDFVTGACAFHLERMSEAEAELDAYIKYYPEGERLEPVEFYAGLTKVRLFKWEEAAQILNGFITKYPQSGMLPSVLYQCALSEFMLDQLEPALAKIDRLHAEFLGSEVIASSWNLKGDIFATEGRSFEEVEHCYLQGKAVADSTPGHEETAAYALWQLEIQTSEVEQWEKAEGYIQEFQAQHADSVYRLDFLVASLPTLVALGKAEDGLVDLRTVIKEFGDQPESVELAEMFGSYLDFVQSNLDLEAAVKELETQRLELEVPPALDGWLRVGLIELLAQQEDQESIDYVRQQFYQLHAKFDPAQQSNYVIVQLARWLAEERGLADEATALYDFIITQRPGSPNYDYALVDTANIQAKSDDPAQRQIALQNFRRVLSEVPNEELQEKAVLGTARVYTKEEKYAEAQPYWEQYLDNRSWTLSRPEANYEFAHCLDQLGQVNDALKIYVSVYANFPGHLDWSTRAYLRTALILKEGGHELKALLVLRDMIQRMGHHDHPVVDQAKKLFVKWRAEYQPEEEGG